MLYPFESISPILLVSIFEQIKGFLINSMESFMYEFSIIGWKPTFFIVLGNLFYHVLSIKKVQALSLYYVKDIVYLMNDHAVHVVYDH